jgi:hypothetical protein
MPYADPEKQREAMRNLMRKRRANKSIEVTDELERLREKNPSYPEHQVWSYEPQKRTIESALDPVPAHRGKSDSPESYGMTGTDITNQNDSDIYDALHPLTEAEKRKKQDENELQNQVEEQKKLG